MKNIKNIFSTMFVIVVSLFLVSIGVYAATTIGTNITTEGYATTTVGFYTQGVLDVGGAATIRGAITVNDIMTISNDLGDSEDGVTIDLNAPLDVVTHGWTAAQKITIDQTGIVSNTPAWNESGRLMSIHSNVTFNDDITNVFGVFSKITAAAATAGKTVNDVQAIVGVLDLLTTTGGTITQQNTSMAVALKGIITDTSTSATWEGGAAVLALEYGGNTTFNGGNYLINAWSRSNTTMTAGILLHPFGTITTGIDLSTADGGTFTTGIAIATSTIGINLTGEYATAGISIGTSGDPTDLVEAADRAINIFTSHNIDTGVVRSVEINQEMLVADDSTIQEALYVNIDSSVKTGDWTNAIVGRINYADSATGNADGGLAAAICGEMNLPAAPQSGGVYYAIDAEINAPQNYTNDASADRPVAFMRFGIWGDSAAVDSFEDGGYLFHLDGVATRDGGLFDSGVTNPSQGATVAVFNAVLKINIQGTDYFIPLGDDDDFSQ